MLLVAGLLVKSRPARVAALVLLVVTILKCFLFDLAQLGGLYRVASFVGLAVCLAAVALLLQRFVLARSDAKDVSVGRGTSFPGLQYSADGSIFRTLPSDVFASFRTPYASQVSSPARRVTTAYAAVVPAGTPAMSKTAGPLRPVARLQRDGDRAAHGLGGGRVVEAHGQRERDLRPAAEMDDGEVRAHGRVARETRHERRRARAAPLRRGGVRDAERAARRRVGVRRRRARERDRLRRVEVAEIPELHGERAGRRPEGSGMLTPFDLRYARMSGIVACWCAASVKRDDRDARRGPEVRRRLVDEVHGRREIAVVRDRELGRVVRPGGAEHVEDDGHDELPRGGEAARPVERQNRAVRGSRVVHDAVRRPGAASIRPCDLRVAVRAVRQAREAEDPVELPPLAGSERP